MIGLFRLTGDVPFDSGKHADHFGCGLLLVAVFY